MPVQKASSRLTLILRLATTMDRFARGISWLAVSAGYAEVVAGEREGFFRLSVLEAKARADVGAVDMPVHFIFFGDARRSPAWEIQLSSGSEND
ncbi:hypothetical protein Q2941_16380 [Bradyrhizobium sp. UFLA05-153]